MPPRSWLQLIARIDGVREPAKVGAYLLAKDPELAAVAG
jgi:hypothetical protein